MGKIRVKVVILPCSATARQEVIAPWIEPCPEDLTLQALCDKIVETFADLHEGKGELNIKRIQDYDGNTLSCRLTVGEAFVESQNIADRTVKVVRLPPERQEFNDNPLRFASIAPASSACPQKRYQGAPTYGARSGLRDVVNADEWVAESTEYSDTRPFKRPRLQDGRPRSRHQPGAGDSSYHRVRSSTGRDPSVLLVEDSQRSPARQEQNPYGTPISLPLNSPFYALASSQNDSLGVPDSPDHRSWARNRARAELYRNTERAKSESPELAASVHEYPSSQPPEERVPSASNTINSSQSTSDQARRTRNDDAVIQRTAQSEGTPQACLSSLNVAGSLTNPPSHRGYHILRSLPEERPSQADPIEADDDLSQKQSIVTHSAQGLSHRSPLATSITPSCVRNLPASGSIGGTRDGQNKDVNGSGQVQEHESNGEIAESLGLVQDFTTSNAPSQTHLAKNIIESRISPPTSAAIRIASPPTTGKKPPHEGAHAEGSQESSEKHGPLVFDESGSPNVGATEATAETIMEANPETTSITAASGSTPSALTPAAEESTQPQVLNVGESAASFIEDSRATIDNPETGDDGGGKETGAIKSRSAKACSDCHNKKKRCIHDEYGNEDPVKARIAAMSRPAAANKRRKLDSEGNRSASESLEKRTQAAEPAAYNDFENDNGVKTSSKKDSIVGRQQSAKTIGKNTVVDATEIANSGSAGASNLKTPESQTGTVLWTAQEEARNPTAGTSKQNPFTEERAVKSSVIGPNERQLSQDVQVEVGQVSGAKSSHNEKDPDVAKNQDTEETNIATIASAKEKREVEEKAVREADAIAHFLAKERMKLQTPSAARSFNRKAKNADPLEGDTSVRRLLKLTNTDNERSSSPRIRSGSIGKGQSMTPLIPSSILKRPAKSALRTSESSTPRSVSFYDDPIAPPGLLKPAASKLVKPKPEGGNVAAPSVTKSSVSSKTSSSKGSASRSGTVGKFTPVQEEVHASDSKSRPRAVHKPVTPTSAAQSKPKTQSKLNVTRDVKLKGRAEGPSEPLKNANKEIELSSNSEVSASTFYSDEESLPRKAKAGPSTKRKLTTNMRSEAPPSLTESDKSLPPSSAVSAEKAHAKDSFRAIEGRQNVQQGHVRAAKPKYEPVLPRYDSSKISDDVVKNDLRDMSKSRSPAQHVSKAAGSISSRSASESRSPASRRDDESSSQSGSEYETGSESEGETESGSDAAGSEISITRDENASIPGTRNSKAGSVMAKVSGKIPERKSQSAPSQSKGPVKSDNEDEKKIAQEMDQQLQRECRQSSQPSQATKTVPKKAPIKSTPALEPKPNISRYPSLTGLRGRAAATAAKELGATSVKPSKAALNKEQPQSQGCVEAESSTSDSEEESSSSSSDDQDNANIRSSQISVPAKSQSGPMRGIRSLLKLSRKLNG